MDKISDIIFTDLSEKGEIYRQYELFKKYFYGSFYRYYCKFCKFAYSILKLKEKNPKKRKEYSKLLEDLHFDVSIDEIISGSTFVLLIGLIISILAVIIFGFIAFIWVVAISISLYLYLSYYPKLLYDKVQKKKESQLILALIYIAMKMRQTPNLEAAILNAAKHLQPPLKLDFLKILWKFYNKEISSLIEAIENYSLKWEDTAYYFTVGIRLIISSIYESNSIRREEEIDKAISDALDILYSKMSLYVRELKSPVEGIYMLGVVLPTLVLTLFPVMVILMGDVFTPSSLFTFFDILIPAMVFLLIKQAIESKRSEFSTSEDLYLYLYMEQHKTKINIIAILSGVVIFFTLSFILINTFSDVFQKVSYASIIVAFIFILSLGLSIVIALKIYYKFYEDFVNRLQIIEKDISTFLFQLGNRLLEGKPIEYAFSEAYKNLEKKPIGRFIYTVIKNIQGLGMSLEEAIFDEEHGALLEYPSSLLQASMEIIVESSKISQSSAGKAALFISKYFVYLEKTKERLLDLLADVTSSMKSLAKFIAPLITGLIVGMSALIVVILSKLGYAIANFTFGSTNIAGNTFGMVVPMDLLSLLNIKNIVSPGVIYLITGIYVIIITALLAYTICIIENGKNEILVKKYIYQYVFWAVILYSIIALSSSIFLWNLGEFVMGFISVGP